MTRREAAVISAYTGILCGSVEDMHRYVEKILERPVMTHEMADKKLWAEIKEASRSDFLSICASAGDPNCIHGNKRSEYGRCACFGDE